MIELRPLSIEVARRALASDRAGVGALLDVQVAVDWPTTAFIRQLAELVPEFEEEPSHPSWFFLVVVDGALVGEIGAKSVPVLGAVEVSYGVVPSARGQGVATGALARFVAEVFGRGVTAVHAEVACTNAPSRRVVRKVGFRKLREVGIWDWWELRAPA